MAKGEVNGHTREGWRNALEGSRPRVGCRERLGRRLEGCAKTVWGALCQLQMLIFFGGGRESAAGSAHGRRGQSYPHVPMHPQVVYLPEWCCTRGSAVATRAQNNHSTHQSKCHEMPTVHHSPVGHSL